MTGNYDANGNTLNQSPSPSADAAGTAYVSDVVGNRADTHSTDSIAGRVHAAEEHIHSAGKVHPTGAAGTLVTATATPWTLGGFAEVVPGSTIGSPFDIHFINFEAMSASTTYELVLYNATTEIARVRVSRTATQDKKDGVPVTMAIQAADSQIQAKVMSASGNADTVNISLSYHLY